MPLTPAEAEPLLMALERLRYTSARPIDFEIRRIEADIAKLAGYKERIDWVHIDIAVRIELGVNT